MLAVMSVDPAIPGAAEPAAVRVETVRMSIRELGPTAALSRATSKVLVATLVYPGVLFLFLVLLPSRTPAFVGVVAMLLVGASLLLLLLLGMVWVMALRGRYSGAGEIHADARTVRLRLPHQADLPAHHVEHAEARGDRCVLRLRGGREVRVPRADVRDEERLFEELASGDPTTAARFPLHRGHMLWHDVPVVVYGALTLPVLLAAATGPRLMLAPAMLYATALGVALLARALAGDAPTGTLVVGSDGLRIEHGRSSRFLSFADIATVRPRPRGMLVELRGGASLHLYLVPSRLLSPRSATSPLDQLARKRVVAAYDLITRRLDEYGEPRPLPAHAPATAPTVEGWRRAIGSALQALAGSYRAGGLTPADAAQIAADPRAPRPQRVGAALAVADSSDVEARERVRVAAELCADEDLRVALEEAAQGELAAETRARLSAPQPRRRPLLR
jgi:hypothetical protein